MWMCTAYLWNIRNTSTYRIGLARASDGHARARGICNRCVYNISRIKRLKSSVVRRTCLNTFVPGNAHASRIATCLALNVTRQRGDGLGAGLLLVEHGGQGAQNVVGQMVEQHARHHLQLGEVLGRRPAHLVRPRCVGRLSAKRNAHSKRLGWRSVIWCEFWAVVACTCILFQFGLLAAHDVQNFAARVESVAGEAADGDFARQQTRFLRRGVHINNGVHAFNCLLLMR